MVHCPRSQAPALLPGVLHEIRILDACGEETKCEDIQGPWDLVLLHLCHVFSRGSDDRAEADPRASPDLRPRVDHIHAGVPFLVHLLNPISLAHKRVLSPIRSMPKL